MTLVDLFWDLSFAAGAAFAIGIFLAVIGPFVEKIR